LAGSSRQAPIRRAPRSVVPGMRFNRFVPLVLVLLFVVVFLTACGKGGGGY